MSLQKKKGIKLKKRQKKQLTRLLIAAALLLAALAISLSTDLVWWAGLLIALPAYLCAGGETLLEAAKNILRGKIFDEKFLMSISSIGALALGEYFEAVAVMLFAGIGELFESCAVSNARGAIKELASLCPDTVDLLIDGKITTVSSDCAKEGDVFVVNPGERIALDGEILEGSAYLDRSSLTGESVPELASAGDTVASGVINLDGTLKIKALRTADNSFAARILACVEDAASKKSKAESLITRFSLWYTPAVCLLAAIIAFIVPLFFGGYGESFRYFSYVALEFLVVSCPCALIISVPLTFFGAIGGAAKQGILFKSNSAPEALSKLSVCVFDKTGTLTEGCFTVTKTVFDEQACSEEEFIKLLAAVENGSTHPVAKAIVAYAHKRCPSVKDYTTFEDFNVSEIRGLGRIMESEKTLLAGNASLMERYGISIPESFILDGTCVYLARGGILLGSVLLCDKVKEDAKAAVEELSQSGVRVVMLSGDSQKAAQTAATELGIENYRAQLLPEQKLDAVEAELLSLSGNGKKLAFVGDGINDAPSLARADVGIAMGVMGSDAAIEAADVVIADDQPSKVSLAHKISKRTVSIAYQNIIFAIGVKLLVMVLCTLGTVNMWGAVFADVGVSVIAILNAMRTLNAKN